jgi:hypothetical protein
MWRCEKCGDVKLKRNGSDEVINEIKKKMPESMAGHASMNM